MYAPESAVTHQLRYCIIQVANQEIIQFVTIVEKVTLPESLKQRFKQIYPLCEMCLENRKDFYTKGEIKTNEIII